MRSRGEERTDWLLPPPPPLRPYSSSNERPSFSNQDKCSLKGLSYYPDSISNMIKYLELGHMVRFIRYS